MTTRGALLAILGLLLGLAPDTGLAGQSRVRGWGAVWGSSARAHSTLLSQIDKRTGAIFGVEGRIAWSRLPLRGGYAEGSLKRDGVSADSRQHIEGFALLGVTVFPGFEITAGPQSRAYVTQSDSTQRWLVWRLLARYDLQLVEGIVWGYGEAWGAVSGQVGAAPAFDNGRGGSVGIILRPARGPVAIRLGYAIDESRLGSGLRRETVEGLTIAVGYGRW